MKSLVSEINRAIVYLQKGLAQVYEMDVRELAAIEEGIGGSVSKNPCVATTIAIGKSKGRGRKIAMERAVTNTCQRSDG